MGRNGGRGCDGGRNDGHRYTAGSDGYRWSGKKLQRTGVFGELRTTGLAAGHGVAVCNGHAGVVVALAQQVVQGVDEDHRQPLLCHGFALEVAQRDGGGAVAGLESVPLLLARRANLFTWQ